MAALHRQSVGANADARAFHATLASASRSARPAEAVVDRRHLEPECTVPAAPSSPPITASQDAANTANAANFVGALGDIIAAAGESPPRHLASTPVPMPCAQALEHVTPGAPLRAAPSGHAFDLEAGDSPPRPRASAPSEGSPDLAPRDLASVMSSAHDEARSRQARHAAYDAACNAARAADGLWEATPTPHASPAREVGSATPTPGRDEMETSHDDADGADERAASPPAEGSMGGPAFSSLRPDAPPFTPTGASQSADAAPASSHSPPPAPPAPLSPAALASPSLQLEEGEYLVEAVLAARKWRRADGARDTWLYLTKWLGYDERTWQDEATFASGRRRHVDISRGLRRARDASKACGEYNAVHSLTVGAQAVLVGSRLHEWATVTVLSVEAGEASHCVVRLPSGERMRVRTRHTWCTGIHVGAVHHGGGGGGGGDGGGDGGGV